MSTHTSGTSSGPAIRRFSLLAGGLLLCAGLLNVVVPQGTAAVPQAPVAPRCNVKNLDDGRQADTRGGWALRLRIQTAAPGDTLRVRGTCKGSFGIEQDLTIVGDGSSGGRSVLSGNALGPALVAQAEAQVRIENLEIAYGRAGGVAVNEGASMTTKFVRVHHNRSFRPGAGFLIGGELTTWWTVIDHNHSEGEGGGVFNYGEIALHHTSVLLNRADVGSGGMFNEGTFDIRYSTVRFNLPDDYVDTSSTTVTCSWIGDQPPADCVP